MKATAQDFLNLVEKKLPFELHLGGSTIVAQSHETGWRVLPDLLVAEINYVSLLELKGRKPVKIKPGQTLCVVPGMAHNIIKSTRGSGRSRWSHIQCEVFPSVSLFHLIEPPLTISGSRSLAIGDLNEELARMLAEERSLTSLVKMQALGWELISVLLERIPFKEARMDLIHHASRLTPVLAHIEQNLAENLSHQLLARMAGFSASRFHFLFRSALGSSPYQYVQKLRLKKAQELLIRTDHSIAEIGQKVGHSDACHFSRIFRQYIGVAPGKYREHMAAGSWAKAPKV